MPLTGEPEHDIPTEIKAGKPRKQAVAIALNEQRKKGKDMRLEEAPTSELKERLRVLKAYNLATNAPRIKEIEAELRARAKDELLPVGDPERAVALKKHEEGITMSQDKRKAKDGAEQERLNELLGAYTDFRASLNREVPTQAEKLKLEKLWQAYKTYKAGINKYAVNAKDELQPVGDLEVVAVKPVTPVPMPTENDGRQRYARAAQDSAQLEEHVKRLKTEPPSAMRDRLIKTAELAIKKGISREEAAREIARASDKKAKAKDTMVKLPEQRSGSEPRDHLHRAAQYEIAGDRARALDSYRAAATGFRNLSARAKTADEANTAKRDEAKARDGITACVAAAEAQYCHPGCGRTKVCDSAESAVRTALERTRAGERVQIVDGMIVKPRVTARVKSRAKDTQQGLNYSDKSKCPVCAGVGERTNGNSCVRCNGTGKIAVKDAADAPLEPYIQALGAVKAKDARDGRSWRVEYDDGTSTTVHRGPGEAGGCPYKAGDVTVGARTGKRRKVVKVTEAGEDLRPVGDDMNSDYKGVVAKMDARKRELGAASGQPDWVTKLATLKDDPTWQKLERELDKASTEIRPANKRATPTGDEELQPVGTE